MAKEDGTWTYPQPKEVVELSWWNTNEERVKHANKIWSATYDQVGKETGEGRAARNFRILSGYFSSR